MRPYPVLLSIVFAWLWASPAHAADPDPERLLREGRLVEALELAARAVAAHPDDVAAQELAIDLFLSLGQVDRAESHARSRIAASPSADSHYLLGRALVDPEASREAFGEALALDPAHARAHMGMGSLEEIAGDLDGARSAYTRAVEQDPGLAEAWVGLARVHIAEGSPAQALETALEGFGHTSSANLALIVARLDAGRARDVLATALAKDGESPVLHDALARTGLIEGDAAFAREHAEKALALDPNDVEARVAFHWSRELAAGRIDESLLAKLISPTTTGATLRRLHDRAVSRSPRSAMARYSRALIRKLEDDEGFLQELVTAASLDPDNDLVAATMGRELLAAGNPGDALEPLTRAVSARPEDRDLTLDLARTLRSSGHRRDAQLLLARVASANPQHVDSQLLYAQTLIEAGRAVEAYAVIKVAMLATQDPRLVAAFVQVAPLAGRPAEAAAVLAPLAERSNSAELQAAVDQLRSMNVR